jgi:hypothetical protein
MNRKLIAYLLLVFVCLGTVGIPLYSHTCSHEAKVFQTLFTRSNHCSIKRVITDHCHPEVPSCCRKASTIKTKLNEDCCTDNVQFIQFHLPVIQKETSWTFVPFVQFQSITRDDFHAELIVRNDGFFIENPPPLSAKDQLAFLCIWRI